jgi:hypothetical protein
MYVYVRVHAIERCDKIIKIKSLECRHYYVTELVSIDPSPHVYGRLRLLCIFIVQFTRPAQVPLSIDSYLINYNFCNARIVYSTKRTRVELSLGSYFLFLIIQRTDSICIMRVDVTKQKVQ